MMGADVGQSRGSGSGSRFTRSHLQAGPVWTTQDMLILVNEIAAVEGDCQDALSSYQKWTIIAENCTALEVVRNASQCRRKWESLLADYNAVKDWELNRSSRGDSYWSLGFEHRQETGLPVDFDKDLYRAIDDFTKATDQANTDPECDSEAEAGNVDVLDAGTFGSKPKKMIHRPTSQKSRTSGTKRVGLMEEHEIPGHLVKDMERIIPTKHKESKKTGPKSKRQKIQKIQSTNQKSETNERKQLSLEEEPEKPVPVIEDVEQILATKVKENTERIHALLTGVDNNTVEEEMSGVGDEETLNTKRVLSKADKLTACLTDLVKNLEQLCDVVVER